MQVFTAPTRAARGAFVTAGSLRRRGGIIAAPVAGFVWRHRRPAIALAVIALLAVPLLRGGDAGTFGLNAAGIGLAALLIRRLLRWRPRWTLRR